jgi:hypothetical protein
MWPHAVDGECVFLDCEVRASTCVFSTPCNPRWNGHQEEWEQRGGRRRRRQGSGLGQEGGRGHLLGPGVGGQE